MKESYSLDIQWLRLHYNWYLLNKLFPLYTKFWLVKLQKFGDELLQNAENLVPRSLQILYIFVLRARVSTTFSCKVVFFPRVIQKYTKFANAPPPKVAPYLLFSGLLIIKNASAKKISTTEEVWKSEASDFKTPQSSLKNTRLPSCIFNSSRRLKIGESPPPTRVWTITSKAFLQTKCWACSITGLNNFLFVNHNKQESLDQN